jgi:hypothetical protein
MSNIVMNAAGAGEQRRLALSIDWKNPASWKPILAAPP